MAPGFLVIDHLSVDNATLSARQEDRRLMLRGLQLEGRDFPKAPVLMVKSTPDAKVEITPGSDWPPLALGLASDVTIKSDDGRTAALSGSLTTAIENLDPKVAGAIAVGTGGKPIGQRLALAHHFDLNYTGDALEIARLAIDVNGEPWLSAEGAVQRLSGEPIVHLSGRTASPLTLPLSLLSAMDAAGGIKADGELRVSNLAFTLENEDWSVSEDVRLTVRSLSGPATISDLALTAKTDARRQGGRTSGSGEGSFTVARLVQGERGLENLTGQMTLTTGEDTLVAFRLAGQYSEKELAGRLETQGRMRFFGQEQETRVTADFAPRRLPAGLPVRPMRLLVEAAGPSDFSSIRLKNSGGEWTGVATLALDAEYSEKTGVSGKITRGVLYNPGQLLAEKPPAGFPGIAELSVSGEFTYEPKSGRGSVAGLAFSAPGLVDAAVSGKYDGATLALEIQRAKFTDPARLLPPGAALPPLPALSDLSLSGSLSYNQKDRSLSVPKLTVVAPPNLETVVSGKAKLAGKASLEVNLSETDLDLAPWSRTMAALAGQELQLGGKARLALSAVTEEGRLTRAEVSVRMDNVSVSAQQPALALQPITGSLQLSASPVPGRDAAVKLAGRLKLDHANLSFRPKGEIFPSLSPSPGANRGISPFGRNDSFDFGGENKDQSATLTALAGTIDLSGTHPSGVDARWELSAAGVEVVSATFPFKSEGPLTTAGRATLVDGTPTLIDGKLTLAGATLSLPGEGVALRNLAAELSGRYELAYQRASADWTLRGAQLTTPGGDAVFLDGLTGRGSATLEGKDYRVKQLSLSAAQPVLKIELPEGAGDPSVLRPATIAFDSPARRTVYPNVKAGGKAELPLQFALEPLAVKGTVSFSNLEVDSGRGVDVRFQKLSGTLPIDSGATPLSDAQLAALAAPKGDAYQPNLTIAELRYEKRKITDLRAEISVKDRSVLVPRLVCLAEAPGLKLPHRVETWGWAQVLPDGAQRYRFEGHVKSPSLLDPVIKPVIKTPLGLKDDSVEAKLGSAYTVSFQAIKYATAEEPEIAISALGPGGEDIVRELFGIDTKGAGGVPLVGDAAGGAVRILKSGGKLRMLLPEGSSKPAAPQVAPASPEKKSEKDALIDTGLNLLEGVLRKSK
ncbi:hypothetical protein HS125_14815 [bacterium]|nr:hypothetical protein [bacterium]